MKNDQPSALAPVPNSEPTAAARSAGLRYVTDSMRGIARVAKRDHFHYVDADGNAVDDPDTLARIKSLVIPPAWTDVWICPLANGHLQATGALALQEFEKFDSEAQAKKNIVRAIESVAEKLGNTGANWWTICIT